ncbi:two-component system, chemotaxis family, CheB/CheR fusion protein [Methylomarinovum tepidoasis]|uniref:Two-component system, chemotaxis family, CheB/CheR fusion protein n=1 Tax=Methylomarinovum tepidoasis TaxID=2840183 RepID=A0AAU9CYV4_9GAMM|nr:EAL domain-containing protein [Methylomarinovum sp. IN45]BCX89234.1 two-component system, chemotaxis family, CheB/CheR fusion protein [Methylomarinovum sp. IN45]
MDITQNHLPRLGELTAQLGNDSLSKVLHSVLETILRLPWLEMNAGGIFLNHPEKGYLELLTHINFTPYIAGTCSRVRHGHCLCGRVAQSSELLHVDCVDERHETRYEGMSEHGHYVVPIRWGDDVLGVMVLYVAHHHAFDADEAKVLGDFAGLIGLLIHTWRVRQDMALADRILIHSTHGILVTDAELKIQWVNQAFERMSGYRFSEVLGKTPGVLSSGRHSAGFYDAMWKTIETEGHWEGEIWNRDKSGAVRPQWLSIISLKDKSGRVLRYAGLYVDLSEIRAAEEKIRRLAYHDEVTGLVNLNWLRDQLPDRLASSSCGRYLVVLRLRMKYFQEINAALGHGAGNVMLREMACRLRETVEADAVARIGTDEFAVVWHCEDDPDLQILQTVRRLEKRLASPLHHDYQVLDLGCVMGASWGDGEAAQVDTLLKQASMALAACGRQQDRSTSCLIYDEELGEKVLQRQRLSGLLTHAIGKKELSLRYQPQVDAQGRLVGAEVLLRWDNAVYGSIPPDFFIPLAEESGKIVEIGTWVFEEVLCQIGRWRGSRVFGDRLPRLAVNLSPLQLTSPHVVNHFIETCRTAGEQPGMIELEVTESSMERHLHVISNHIRHLADYGFRIAIDDFGTGHSSLARLHQFPLRVLKIDRSFVTHMALGNSHLTLLKSIVDMAHGLGLEVVVEGVETAEQYRTLVEMGCDVFQGYFFSRPLEPTAFVMWARERWVTAGEPC